ncbi:MAG TPA: hypothetical protein VIP58_10285 [Nocardioides sp.]
MNHYALDLEFVVKGYEDRADFERHVFAVLDHLYELDGVIDPDLLATASTAKVIYSLSVASESEFDAVLKALGLIRTAVHACDGATPGWENMFRPVEQSVRLAELADA